VSSFGYLMVGGGEELWGRTLRTAHSQSPSNMRMIPETCPIVASETDPSGFESLSIEIVRVCSQIT